MPKALITLACRQVIDAASEGSFAKNVLHHSYEEFKLKSQAYNPDGKFNTFTEMKLNDGRANSLHYKTGFAISGFIETLQKKIPGLHNALSQQLVFDTYQFELIESALNNKMLHIVAIHYITAPLSLYEIIGDNLLLSYSKPEENLAAPTETFLLKIRPGLSILNYHELRNAVNLLHENERIK